MKYVILAGGTGTRLWPMSRTARPKQFSQMISDLTMFEDTLRRFATEPNHKNVYVATGPQFAAIVSDILPDFPKDHFIIDPEKRDTGPAMALVAAMVARTAPDEPMALLPSDHYVRNIQLFRKTFAQADELVRSAGKLVLVGISPTFPNVQMGHIRIGPLKENHEGINIYTFAGFREKPAYQVAKEYMESGDYLWNAGFYIWTPRKLLEAYRKYAPEIGNTIEEIAELIAAGKTDQAGERYHQLPKISIDYAVSEKMTPDEILVIKGEFGWSDIGSWEQLYEQLGDNTDEQGNLVKGDWIGVDTTSSLIYGSPKKIIATIGLSDMVVVDTPDALLISPKGRAPDVKKIVAELQESGRETYL